MPFRHGADPSSSARRRRPHAQDIDRAAFNHAFAAYAGEADREARAHRIAWAAVKRSYIKIGGEWVARGR
jgi:cation transport regulator